MRQRKYILLILLVLPFFLFMTVTEEEEHSSSPMAFIGKVINFLVLFGGLTFLLYKPVRKFLEGRSQEIERSMREAKDSRRDSEKRLQVAKSRLEKLEKEIEEIRKDAEKEAGKDKDRIVKASHKESERIKHYARQEIEMLSLVGVRELKEYTAELACALAQERIEKKMTPENQAIIIDKSIERLEELYEKPSSGKKIHARTS